MSCRSKDKLWGYQKHIADLILKKSAVLMAVDMGLGKTGASLTAIRTLLDQFTVRRVLVVAPLEVAKNTWPDEIRAWEHTRVLSYSVLVGTAEERTAAARVDCELHIINRENIRWLFEFWGAQWPYDMLVWDESSALAAGEKQTSRTNRKSAPRMSRFGTACAVRKYCDRVLLLTGTPAPRGLESLWGQAYILDQGERLGSNKDAFLHRWFQWSRNEYERNPHEFAHDQIMDRMKDVMVGMREEDYKKLPPRVYSNVVVRLEDKDLREYRRFERSLVSIAHDVEACSRGVLTNKLLQFANGSMYREDQTIAPIHTKKLDALDQVIEEANGNNILVAYGYKFDARAIKERFKHTVLFSEEKNFVQKWNAGEIRLGVAHPASIGHGLNLQHGGHIAVWYGLTWSMEFYQQFNVRLSRPGQKYPFVSIRHIVAEGTADEDVLTRLADRSATQDSITDAVRLRVLRSAGEVE